MPISFRTARNLGLGILLAVIFIMGIFSYSLMHTTLDRLKTIVEVDELRRAQYTEIAEFITEARQDFYSYLWDKKEEVVSSIILNLDEASKRLEIIEEQNPKLSLDEMRMHQQISLGIQRFKTAILSYAKEVKAGDEGSSLAGELKQLALVSCDDVVQLAHAANQYVQEEIENKQHQVLKTTLLYQKLLTVALILGIIFTLGVAILLGYAIGYPIHQLVNGTKEVARGNLDYTLKITTNHEFGPITTAFNKMVEDLRRSQDEILRSKEMLTRVTEGIEEGLMLLDTNFKILWANKKLIQTSGFKIGDIIDNYCYKITHRRDEPCKAPENVCPLDEVIKTGKSVTVVHTHFDKEGNKFYAEVCAYPLRDEEGEIIQFVHVSRDITQRVELEQRLKENILTLEKSREELEKKIGELEKFARLTVDRELKMMELKKRIKELEEGGG